MLKQGYADPARPDYDHAMTGESNIPPLCRRAAEPVAINVSVFDDSLHLALPRVDRDFMYVGTPPTDVIAAMDHQRRRWRGRRQGGATLRASHDEW